MGTSHLWLLKLRKRGRKPAPCCRIGEQTEQLTWLQILWGWGISWEEPDTAAVNESVRTHAGRADSPRAFFFSIAVQTSPFAGRSDRGEVQQRLCSRLPGDVITPPAEIRLHVDVQNSRRRNVCFFSPRLFIHSFVYLSATKPIYCTRNGLTCLLAKQHRLQY